MILSINGNDSEVLHGDCLSTHVTCQTLALVDTGRRGAGAHGARLTVNRTGTVGLLQTASVPALDNALVAFTLADAGHVNVIARGKSMIQMEIISPEYEKINQTILTRFNRGTTLIHIEGGYKRGEAYEVQTVVRPRELFAIKMAVLEIDPTAFVVVGNVSEVNGRGFTLKKEG